jgi:hypothetical protein
MKTTREPKNKMEAHFAKKKNFKKQLWKRAFGVSS